MSFTFNIYSEFLTLPPLSQLHSPGPSQHPLLPWLQQKPPNWSPSLCPCTHFRASALAARSPKNALHLRPYGLCSYVSQVLPDASAERCMISPTPAISPLCFIYITSLLSSNVPHVLLIYITFCLRPLPSKPIHKMHEAGICFLSFLFTVLMLVNQNSRWHLVSAQTT